MFQSTLPRRERRGGDPAERYSRHVSIHAPTKGATGLVNVVLDIQGVSIHAPTKGATDPAILSAHDINVSIHAPTKGATLTSIS